MSDEAARDEITDVYGNSLKVKVDELYPKARELFVAPSNGCSVSVFLSRSQRRDLANRLDPAHVRAEQAAEMAEQPSGPTVEIDRQLLQEALDCIEDSIADNEDSILRADQVVKDQAMAARIEAILKRGEG